MEKIKLALVGCGGMGTRHLYGMRELMETPFNNVNLVALCDIRRENAELAATEAEQLFGTRPAVFTDIEEMARRMPDLDAVSVVTDPSVHHNVVCQALESIGRKRSKPAKTRIMEILKTSDHWYVQGYAYNALRKLGWKQELSN